jgi:hypothetical protein
MARDRTRGALVGLLLLLAACNDAPSAGSAGGHPTPPPRPIDPARERVPGTKPVVVLVTLDGVRWQDVFEGTDAVLSRAPSRPAPELMPNLHRLAKERGAAIGAPARGVMTAVGPNYVSLPGYIEILTGRRSLRCQDNDCPRIEEATFLDYLHESGSKVATFASWDRMDRAASARPGTFLLSYGRHGEKAIDPSPGVGDYRPDRVTADLALRYLDASRPDFLFLALGDPDELGHNNDYPGYLSSIRQADAILGQLFQALDRLGDRGANAHVFVTADHGRSKDFIGHGGQAPESGRVFLVATGPKIKARGFIASPRERHLTDIVPTIRKILDLPRDDSPHAGVAIDELFAAP